MRNTFDNFVITDRQYFTIKKAYRIKSVIACPKILQVVPLSLKIENTGCSHEFLLFNKQSVEIFSFHSTKYRQMKSESVIFFSFV